MKAKYFKKLRNKINKFVPFEIYESWDLFGNFKYSDLEMTILADSPLLAIKRYFKKYKNKHKENHKLDFQIGGLSETTHECGKLKVVNKNTGFKYYYH